MEEKLGPVTYMVKEEGATKQGKKVHERVL